MSNKGSQQTGVEAAVDVLAESVRKRFAERFGRPPKWMVAAPGRVNLIGDHVDYNDGIVLPLAIDRYTIVAGDVAESGSVCTIQSVNANESLVVDLGQPLLPSGNHWGNYIKGVFFGFLELVPKIPAMDLLVMSSVPMGGGLSSSAALEVAIATVLESATEFKLKPKQKALLCQKAEHDFASVPCGVMDQFASVFGQQDSMLQLDCRDLSIRNVAFDNDRLALLVVNSNVQHELAASEYSIRRKQCEQAVAALGVSSLRDIDRELLQSKRYLISDLEYRRVLHVVSENERTVRFVDLLVSERFEEAGTLLFESHDSLRYDYEVSCEELDRLVLIAKEIGVEGGVYGSRMTGGGFGGSTITLVDRKSVQNVAIKMLESFSALGKQNQIKGNQKQATAFVTRPSKGAHEIKNS